MKTLLKIFLGLSLVALIGVAAVSVENVPGSAATAESKLRQRAADALGVSAAQWAAFEIDGQKLVISGEAPSEETRAALVQRMSSAQWRGGALLGGVTAVDASGLTAAPAAPIADPFTLIAQYENGAVTLTGYAPNDDTRHAMRELARAAFPGAEISGTIDLAAGAPAPEHEWLSAVNLVLAGLAQLQHGEAVISGAQIEISGTARSQSSRQSLTNLSARLPDAFATTIDVAVDAPPPEETRTELPEETPELTAEAQSQPDEQAVGSSPEAAALPADTPAAPEENEEEPAAPDCVALLQAAANERRIGFSSARADIDTRSRNQLREIASQLSNCPQARLRVTGHTDASGNAARNLQLSGYRADAVRTFLTSVGAPAARITARGVGSAQPLVSNATPAGRERNRRIEIEVIATDE
ncbi:OmpA family protein [Hyphococcus sp.]|uniref:OmpA family protein n=1 Tax=Hyphococcus sp. TaxID=2038636 RepID=UPI003CCB9435